MLWSRCSAIPPWTWRSVWRRVWGAGERPGLAQREEEFDLVALQRNLKALGTFGYQLSVRGKSFYKRYVPGTLELVRRNLARNPRWDGLRRVLSAHLPELA